MSRFDKGIRNIIFELLYQGIVGAMLFDIFDPVRGMHVVTIGLVLITLAVFIDYWQMTVNLGVVESDRSYPYLDAAIGVLFGLSYFAFSRLRPSSTPTSYDELPPLDDCRRLCVGSLALLSGAYGAINWYEGRIGGASWKVWVPRLLLFLIPFAAVFAALFSRTPLTCVVPSFLGMGLSTALYLWYVRRVHRAIDAAGLTRHRVTTPSSHMLSGYCLSG